MVDCRFQSGPSFDCARSRSNTCHKSSPKGLLTESIPKRNTCLKFLGAKSLPLHSVKIHNGDVRAVM